MIRTFRDRRIGDSTIQIERQRSGVDYFADNKPASSKCDTPTWAALKAHRWEAVQVRLFEGLSRKCESSPM
jgi:hypothetical protein